MAVTRFVEVTLTIPDNEAETALATLRRLEIEVADLRRADLYRLELDPQVEDETIAALRGLETIYNPNKHVLHVRRDGEPRPGEVWVSEPGREPRQPGAPIGKPHSDASLRVGGVTLPGVHRIERLTAWRLFDAAGNPVPAEVVVRATKTLLCNDAFQRAVIAGSASDELASRGRR